MVQQSFLESRVMIVYYINCSVWNTVDGIHEDKRNCDLYTVTKSKTTPVTGCYWQPYFKGYIWC
jgi:hypothetical protein